MNKRTHFTDCVIPAHAGIQANALGSARRSRVTVANPGFRITPGMTPRVIAWCPHGGLKMSKRTHFAYGLPLSIGLENEKGIVLS